jgi:hypothetical protein
VLSEDHILYAILTFFLVLHYIFIDFVIIMVLGKVKSLTISFDCLNDSNVPVYSSGDTVSGRVNLEVTGEIRVKSLKIHARGHAKVRWTESRNAGSNTAYTQNYTEEVEYFNHKDILIGHERGKFLISHYIRLLCMRTLISFSAVLIGSLLKVSKLRSCSFSLTFKRVKP